MAMLSEEMEQKLAKYCNRSLVHPALGRTPEQVSQTIEAVSLGSSCGVKMTLRRMGLDEANMPFDWIRSSGEGVVRWLRNGFEDFLGGPFNRFTRNEINFRDLDMTVYRSTTHSFWHDNLEDTATQQKLIRRVERFNQLANDTRGRALLFVRACATTEEPNMAETMYEALQQRFGVNGRRVFLLLIIEDQGFTGPIVHAKYPNLIFWVQALAQGPLAHDGNAPGPYEEGVAYACRHILQEPPNLLPGRIGFQVSYATDIMAPGGPLRSRGLRDSDCGNWCGYVTRKNAIQKTLFAAFEGFAHKEIAYAA